MSHPAADRLLIERTVALGCRAPAFTREQRPSLFRSWEHHALLVIAAAHGESGEIAADIDAAKRECDAHACVPATRALPRRSLFVDATYEAA